MEYLVRAYLDDYHLITVEIDRKFHQGESENFFLSLNDAIANLTIDSKLEQEEKVIYKLNYPGDIIIGLDYQLLAIDGYRTPLQYRYIVKTEKFNKDHYYDGDDLGSSVKDSITSFKLWAPTASNVTLIIDNRYFPLKKDARGLWRCAIARDLSSTPYNYLISVNGEVHLTTDPYAKACTINGKNSVVVKQETIQKLETSRLFDYRQAVIYETSVRDFSSQRNFLGLIKNIPYLKSLGITHLQLMPINDFGSVDDKHPSLFYNWGYDPVNYQCLEGTYSSNVDNSLQVIADFKETVVKLHQRDIKVNLDVVFNHHYNAANSNFAATVPFYYFRYDQNDKLCEGTYCGNEFDSQMLMGRKFIIDTLKYYLNEFDVDGFRFDLMNFIDIETMRQVDAQLRKMKPSIMLYGEGWDMQAGISKDLVSSLNNKDQLPNIAFFNDGFRDLMRGSNQYPENTGYCSGNVWMVRQAIEKLQNDDNQWINYVECHDDLTCYDKLKKCCINESEEQIIDRCKLLIGCTLLSNGISFLHAGQEQCISHQGLSNNYNVKDEINSFEDKTKHLDVFDYTRKLISIKKKLNLFSNKNKEYEEHDGSIICHSADYLIFINPSTLAYDYSLNKEYYVVFDKNGNENGVVSGIFKVEPISINILKEKHD